MQRIHLLAGPEPADGQQAQEWEQRQRPKGEPRRNAQAFQTEDDGYQELDAVDQELEGKNQSDEYRLDAQSA